MGRMEGRFVGDICKKSNTHAWVLLGISGRVVDYGAKVEWMLGLSFSNTELDLL